MHEHFAGLEVRQLDYRLGRAEDGGVWVLELVGTNVLEVHLAFLAIVVTMVVDSKERRSMATWQW